jgi:hypothetical protein
MEQRLTLNLPEHHLGFVSNGGSTLPDTRLIILVMMRCNDFTYHVDAIAGVYPAPRGVSAQRRRNRDDNTAAVSANLPSARLRVSTNFRVSPGFFVNPVTGPRVPASLAPTSRRLLLHFRCRESHLHHLLFGYFLAHRGVKRLPARTVPQSNRGWTVVTTGMAMGMTLVRGITEVRQLADKVLFCGSRRDTHAH